MSRRSFGTLRMSEIRLKPHTLAPPFDFSGRAAGAAQGNGSGTLKMNVAASGSAREFFR
jgi:hypothetical protein